MLESTWLFLGTLATLSTLAAVLIPARLDTIAIVAGVVGFILWGMVAYGALNLVVVGDAVTYTFSMPPVTVVTAMISLLPGYVALTGPVDLIAKARSPQAREI